jgi:hypothetical protein
MIITIKTPEEYSTEEIFEFYENCCYANSVCPNSSAFYDNILSGRGVDILTGKLSKEKVIQEMSFLKSLTSYGYDKYLSDKSKQIIIDYKIFRNIR